MLCNFYIIQRVKQTYFITQNIYIKTKTLKKKRSNLSKLFFSVAKLSTELQIITTLWIKKQCFLFIINLWKLYYYDYLNISIRYPWNFKKYFFISIFKPLLRYTRMWALSSNYLLLKWFWYWQFDFTFVVENFFRLKSILIN